ncbi:TOG array regulator of axonemal microtubules protein 1 isoform X2 [Prorops nasuta]|uniref:TOG array regulator of axonemal microtubules protein 1 isoform X2 n=1 Tax=Prorops nasuta TaxID=863751 RepID=UPI0034CDE86D
MTGSAIQDSKSGTHRAEKSMVFPFEDCPSPSQGIGRSEKIPFAQTASSIQLTPIWEHVVRFGEFPSEVDARSSFQEISVRLSDPEWEVRQHALRVLQDVLPALRKDLFEELAGSLLAELIVNLGHSVPAVRKGALDTLRIYISHSTDRETLLRKEGLHHSLGCETLQVDVTSGIILSTPSLLFPSSSGPRPSGRILQESILALGSRLVQATQQGVALKSLCRIRDLIGHQEFYFHLDQDPNLRKRFETLCEVYQIDCEDAEAARRVHFRDRKSSSRRGSSDNDIPRLLKDEQNQIREKKSRQADEMESESDEDSCDEEGFVDTGSFVKNDDERHEDDEDDNSNDRRKVDRREGETTAIETLRRNENNDTDSRIVLETQIQFDRKTAITMTILEDKDLDVGMKHSEESKRRRTPKRVHFGGEIVKLRTPDSEDIEMDSVQMAEVASALQDGSSRIPLPVLPATKMPRFDGRPSSHPVGDQQPERRRHNRPMSASNYKPEVPRVLPKDQPERFIQPIPATPMRKKRKKKKKNVKNVDTNRDLNYNSDHADVLFGRLVEEEDVQNKPSASGWASVQDQKSAKNSTQTRYVAAASDKGQLPSNASFFGKNGFLEKNYETSESGPGSSSDADERCQEASWEDLGLVDQEALDDLHNKEDWRARVRGLERVASALRTSSGLRAIEPRLGSLLHTVLGGERSCRVAAAGLTVAKVAVAGVTTEALEKRLPQLAWGLARQGGPNAAQLARIAMLRLRPTLLLEQLLQPQCIAARNAKTRENALLLLIFSLVTFPSTEFKVDTVAVKVATMVADRRRRVRQAALDTLAVLAQIYDTEDVLRAGQEATKGRHDAQAIMSAIRARLSRKSLPLVSADGLVVYGLQISPSVQIVTGPDVDWIVAGCGSVSPGTARTRGQLIGATTKLENRKRPRDRNNPWKNRQDFVAVGVELQHKKEHPVAWQLVPNRKHNSSSNLTSVSVKNKSDSKIPVAYSRDRRSSSVDGYPRDSDGKPGKTLDTNIEYDSSEPEKLDKPEVPSEMPPLPTSNKNSIYNYPVSASAFLKPDPFVYRAKILDSRGEKMKLLRTAPEPIDRFYRNSLQSLNNIRKIKGEEDDSSEPSHRSDPSDPSDLISDGSSFGWEIDSALRTRFRSLSMSQLYSRQSNPAENSFCTVSDEKRGNDDERSENEKNRRYSTTSQFYQQQTGCKKGHIEKSDPSEVEAERKGPVNAETSSSSLSTTPVQSANSGRSYVDGTMEGNVEENSPKTNNERSGDSFKTHSPTVSMKAFDVLDGQAPDDVYVYDLENNRVEVKQDDVRTKRGGVEEDTESREEWFEEEITYERTRVVRSVKHSPEKKINNSYAKHASSSPINENIVKIERSDKNERENDEDPERILRINDNIDDNFENYDENAGDNNNGNNNNNNMNFDKKEAADTETTEALPDTPSSCKSNSQRRASKKSLSEDFGEAVRDNDKEDEEEAFKNSVLISHDESFRTLEVASCPRSNGEVLDNYVENPERVASRASNHENSLVTLEGSPAKRILSRERRFSTISHPAALESTHFLKCDEETNSEPAILVIETRGPSLGMPSLLPRRTKVVKKSVEKIQEKPKPIVNQCFVELESKDWEITLKGLKTLSQIAKQHPEYLNVCVGGTIGRLLGRHIRNLRSQVARAACSTAGDIFERSTQIRATVDQDLDDIASPLLHRTADTNRFLRGDCNSALDRMVQHLPAHKTVSIIVLRGASHQNAIVRAATARLLCGIVERFGPEHAMSLPRDSRDKLLSSGARLLMDGSLDARNHAKKMFRRLVCCDGFKRCLLDAVPETTLRHIEKTLKSL